MKIYNLYYYLIYHKSPYIDIASLFSSAIWPRLSSLTLSDLTIRDDKVATRFLAAHPGLREISVSLSVDTAVDGIPEIPFNIDADFLAALGGNNPDKDDDIKAAMEGYGTRRAFLPNLETLGVHSQLARSILRAITKHRSLSFSHCLRSIGTIEPRDWGCSVSEIDLDDPWERLFVDDSETPPQTSASDVDVMDENTNLLETLINVRSLVVRNIRRLSQLDSLFTATGPRLENLRVESWFIPGLVGLNFILFFR